MAIEKKTGDMMANPHALGLSKSRFWSSGDELPIERIIARVLADPTEDDLVTLKRHFGEDLILATWQKLIERGEIAPSVIPITKTMLNKLIALS